MYISTNTAALENGIAEAKDSLRRLSRDGPKPATIIASVQATLDSLALAPYRGLFARAIRASSDFDRSMRQIERLVGKP
jgi:hypothetical protein